MTIIPRNKILSFLILFISFTCVFIACKNHFFRSNYTTANALIHSTENLETKPFLKAHFKNGDICILKDSWKVDSLFLSGTGSLFDFNRKKISEGSIKINIDSVAIFETNTSLENAENGRMTAMTIMTSLDVVLGVFCITNPKACFGSCPTFYINEEDNFHYADAEGFSNAISPSLEYYDIDALNCRGISSDSTFNLIMKNEALETHCLNQVKLLAYPVNDNEKLYQSPNNRFYLTEDVYNLSNAIGPEGEITKLLESQDREERFSVSDIDNLSSKEELILNFDTNKELDNLGLIINFRQTLMTTYFIYSAMGYMGDEVGDMFAKIETDKDVYAKLENGIKKELGRIEVLIWDEFSSTWIPQNGFYETGPIAMNNQIIPLSKLSNTKNIKVKIKLNKGLWRIDQVSLTNIIKEIVPIEIMPSKLYKGDKEYQNGLAKMSDDKEYLISMPGNKFKFEFDLPKENANYDVFLYSKGYYLEWMRNSWVKDKDLLTLNQMLENPKDYLKEQSKAYKAYEADMEEQFWNSKIETNILGYENH